MKIFNYFDDTRVRDLKILPEYFTNHISKIKADIQLGKRESKEPRIDADEDGLDQMEAPFKRQKN